MLSCMTQVHDTKQRLLDTAQKLFYARSYEDVGVQEICQEAGVKKGSFYHFFPSKRDLTLAILDELFGERPMAAACELTKLYEEVQRGRAADLLARFREKKPRGEFTLVIAGAGLAEGAGPAQEEEGAR